jgi:hypothetical protein
MIGVCSLCTLNAWLAPYAAYEDAHWLDGAVCLQTPLNEEYRFVLTRLRSGRERVDIVSNDTETYINDVRSYAFVGQYLVGSHWIVEGEAGYFWVDGTTREYRYIDIDTEDEFRAALEALGIAQVPMLIPVDDVCETQICQPCPPDSPSQ